MRSHPEAAADPQIGAVLRFVAAINRADVDGLLALTADGFVQVDPGGVRLETREAQRRAWRSYFTMFPDYRITVERVFHAAPWVALFGTATGTAPAGGELLEENRWGLPAAWLAGLRGELVAHWQVYADNEPVRRIPERLQGGES